MARTVATHKRNGGFEAPRNSLEFPGETSYSFYAAGDNARYDYHSTKWTEKNYVYTEAPIKKLISEEISNKPNARQNAPSLVARLMGVDMLPLESKPVPKQVQIQMKNDVTESNLLKTELSKDDSIERVLCSSNSSLKTNSSLYGHTEEKFTPNHWSNSTLNKPKRREHPQEEELQKFKKEFEAWQAARFKECSKIVQYSSSPERLIAQESLNREKMVLYSNPKRTMASERIIESKELSVKADLPQGDALQNCKNKDEGFMSELESHHSKKNSRADSRGSSLRDYDHKPDNVSAPTKIVILRPGPDRMSASEDSWSSSPSTSEERGSIEAFLEEVKERLKSELQGKTSNRSTTVRGGGIETPYWEKPSEPKQIAHRIAQQVRESVTRDIGMNLFRSESTRSYRSEIKLAGTGSPEFINRDTWRFLTERLRNVLKGGTREELPYSVHNDTRSSSSDIDKLAARKSRDICMENQMNYQDDVRKEAEKPSRSFRQESTNNIMLHKDLSHRNLVRSLSAPVSGTSFGKLLLEDRHILTGAHIRRKHEVIEKLTMNAKQRKERFNIRKKVSSFRCNLMLRGRLFSGRYQSEEPHKNKHENMKDIRSGPTVMTSFYDRNDNSTEVPPSPASVCSSIHEEYWRPADCFSNTPTSDGNQLEDTDIPHVFREINSNLNELRRQLNHLDGYVSDAPVEEQSIEVEMEITDHTEAYIKELLIASGLYDGSCSRSLSRYDPLGKPISNQVFEEVEESYRKRTKDVEVCIRNHDEQLDHKMLLDLLNESLPAVLTPPVNIFMTMKSAISPALQIPTGRNLLNRVWDIVQVYVNPPADRSYYALDSMLARDLKSNTWSRLIEDDISALCKDLEYWIIGDMIEDMVNDLQS